MAQKVSFFFCALWVWLVLCGSLVFADSDEDAHNSDVENDQKQPIPQPTKDFVSSFDLTSCTIQVGTDADSVINLKPLAVEDGFPKYVASFDVSVKDKVTAWNYSYNPCVPYTLPFGDPHSLNVFGDGCHSVVMCKYNYENSRMYIYSLGINSPDKVKVEVTKEVSPSGETKVITLNYTGILSLRFTETKIRLVCDPNRKGENDGFFNITFDDGQFSIQAELHHECCCVGGCWKRGLGAINVAKRGDTDGEIMLVVAGFLVGLVMLVALIGGLCYVKRTHLHFYAKLPGIVPAEPNMTSTIRALLANPKEGPQYPDFRDYEPAGFAAARRKLIPVLSDSNIQIQSVEMGQRLGGGIFGDTHLAKWSEMTVTLKRLTLAIHNNQLTPETMEWMKKEVWFLSQQRHKNIVCIIGLCLDGRLPFLLTEYVIGECLKDFLKDNGQLLTWPQRTRMCNQVADGMAFLHSTKPPIIHRDLRCGNLFLSDNDLVKVADFGLIKLLQPMREQCQNDECSCQRQLSACPARLRWSAPELLTHPCAKEGEGAVITTACDVYSFGMAMWEMVLCKDPFNDIITETEVIEIVRNGGRPDVPPSTDMMGQYKDLMKSCWQQLPSARPQFKQIATKLKDLIGAARSHQKQVNTSRVRLQKLRDQAA